MPFSAVSEIVRRHSADRTRGRARPPGGAGAGGCLAGMSVVAVTVSAFVALVAAVVLVGVFGSEAVRVCYSGVWGQPQGVRRCFSSVTTELDAPIVDKRRFWGVAAR